jgi:hypothetical protein
VVAVHLDVMSFGLWVVGCGFHCRLARAVSYNTHFVDHPDKHSSPHIICLSNETPAKVSTGYASSYTGEASSGLSRGRELVERLIWGGGKYAFLVN